MRPFGLADRKCKSVFQDGCGDYYQSTAFGKWSNFNGALIDTTGTNSRTGIAAIECTSRTGPQVSIPAYSTYFAGVARLGARIPDKELRRAILRHRGAVRG